MPRGTDGSIIGGATAPTASAASGIWTMAEVHTLRTKGTWPLPYIGEIEYLVVGGGGCGGNGTSVGGGGGGGGYLSNYGGTKVSVNQGVVITCTVGLGGVGVLGTAPPPDSNEGHGTLVDGEYGKGGDSIFSPAGGTAITATGGGMGGGNFSATNAAFRHGQDGGCGGGSGPSDTAGVGAATPGDGNTPPTTPIQGKDGGLGHDGARFHTSTGGGGGSFGVGGNANQDEGNPPFPPGSPLGAPFGGVGGNGTLNLITEAAGAADPETQTYGGGGGGNCDHASSIALGRPEGGTGGGGDGGAGGAGVGALYGQNGTNGLGGGGGGGYRHDEKTDGGSGVVILRLPTSDYVTHGTIVGSPTVTEDGSDTVIKFTATGVNSYTT